MSRTKNPDFIELYTLLLKSYRRCIQNKPPVKKTSFHFYHESNLHDLTKSLINRTYKPWKSSIFVVTNPKPREVIAAHMRDRVVHHLLHDYMIPYWEKIFCANSYACRKGKGPLRAVRDLKDFLHKQQRRAGPPLYYLKFDIQSFFATIDLNVLQKIVHKKMHNEFYRWLFDVILWHRSTDQGNYQLKSHASMWRYIPDYKSMFKVPRHMGLPIGNLTSQFFANAYLNELDQFITHQVKNSGIMFWQRYVDDLLLISEDRMTLRRAIPKIQDFLVSKLNISLNHRKTILQPVSNGIDHLGYFVKPGYVRVRNRVVGNYKRKMDQLYHRKAPDDEDIRASANSYFGYFRQADSFRLRQRLAAKIRARRKHLPLLDVSPDFDKLVRLEDKKALEEKDAAARLRKVSFAKEMAQVVSDKRRLSRYVRHWRDLQDLLES